MPVNPSADPAEAPEPAVSEGAAFSGARPSLLRIVTGLSALNALIAAAGFITGPLQARALGASGRGDLAAILVPLNLAPALLGLAVGAYATREAARGRRPGELLGSLGIVMLLTSAVGIVAGVLLAPFLAEGRDVVADFLLIGAGLLPISLVAGIPASILASLEAWRLFSMFRLVPVLIYLLGTIVLYAIGELTVASSAILSLAGGVAATALLVPFCLRHRPWTFRRSTAREGVSFGVKYWLGGLAITLNGRLDQLLMIKLVSSAQLGYYAIAATIAQVPGYLAAAVGPPLLSRISAGNRSLAERATRCTLLAGVLSAVALGACLPVLLPLLFGAGFERSVVLAEILLAGGVLTAVSAVLSAALVADGAPGTTSIAEVAALVVTVAGLALFLSRFGIIAAAWTTLAAGLVGVAIQLRSVRRRFGGGYRNYLIPRREDWRWFASQLQRPGTAVPPTGD